MKQIPIAPTLIATAALLLSTPAPADEFCVSNSNELQSALDDAAFNGQDDIIRLEPGIYSVSANGGNTFTYDAFQWGGDDHNLTLEGGWIEGKGFPCYDYRPDVSIPIIDGEDTTRAMLIRIRGNSGVNVSGMWFQNGTTSQAGMDGTGLAIYVVPDKESGHTRSILVERNIFHDNYASYGGGLYIGGLDREAYTAILGPGIFGAPSRMGVVNNVFSDNYATRFGAALLMQDGYEGGLEGVGIYVVNNTVVNNGQFAITSNNDGIFGIRGNTPNVYVANNNMWDNQRPHSPKDLYIEDTVGYYSLRNNNIDRYIGKSPTFESNNIRVEPEYIPCLSTVLCFGFYLTPTIHSPLVDAGRHPCPSGQICALPFWSMPDFDSAGNLRVAQGTVDIGAYENHDRFFVDRFESSD